MTTERKVILTIDGRAPVELPVLKATVGNDCIDIRRCPSWLSLTRVSGVVIVAQSGR